MKNTNTSIRNIKFENSVIKEMKEYFLNNHISDSTYQFICEEDRCCMTYVPRYIEDEELRAKIEDYVMVLMDHDYSKGRSDAKKFDAKMNAMFDGLYFIYSCGHIAVTEKEYEQYHAMWAEVNRLREEGKLDDAYALELKVRNFKR